VKGFGRAKKCEKEKFKNVTSEKFGFLITTTFARREEREITTVLIDKK
jgi:hypothetical protein